MQNVTHRLRAFIDHEKMTVNAFEKKCSIGQSKVAKALRNGTEFGFSVIEQISSTFPELNMNWLISGRGSMLLSAGSEAPPPATGPPGCNELKEENYQLLRENRQLRLALEAAKK